MKNRFIKAKIIPAVVLIFISFGFQNQRNQRTLDQLFASIDEEMSKVSSLEFMLKRTERINNEVISVENYIRFQAKPFKSMIQFMGDKEGDFLIYIPEENEGKALFIPGGFPYINVNLHPESYLMRKNSHYTVGEIGVKFIVDQIKGNYLKWKNNFHYRGVINLGNNEYHRIEGILDDLTYEKYQVKPNETLSQLGKRFFVSEYMLMEINDNVDALDDDISGKTILIPTCYANHIEMLVNTKTYFPEKVVIKDKKGLFEQYEYAQIKINHGIDQNYFDEDFLEDLD